MNNVVTTKIKFNHDGFGIHTARTERGMYVITPVTYDANGKPRLGYNASFVIPVIDGGDGRRIRIASGKFAECRAACKAHAQEQAS